MTVRWDGGDRTFNTAITHEEILENHSTPHCGEAALYIFFHSCTGDLVPGKRNNKTQTTARERGPRDDVRLLCLFIMNR